MPADAFVNALNTQISHEFAASQQYVAIATFYDAQTLPRLAAFFYAQSVEERNHAMMMVQYVLDSGAAVVIPGVSAPRVDFSGVVDPVRHALDQERRVSDQIGELVAVAREAVDYAGEQFMMWFLKEQVEEVATMSSLLDVCERCSDDPMLIEDYVAREHAGGGPADPSAPAAAGGAL